MRKIIFILSFISFTPLLAQVEKEITGNFKNDITYLSSDQLEGRLTASSGEMKSSLYIADAFKSNKLKPYGDSGTYLQTFKIVRLRISQCRKPLFWEERNERVELLDPIKAEYYPLSYSCNRDSLDAPVFQAGFGIKAPELNHNDYADSVGCKGKVFVIKLGGPEPNNPHSKFEPFTELSYKVDQAVKMGARGIIFVRADTFAKVPSGHLDRTIKPTAIPVVYASYKISSLQEAVQVKMDISIAQVNGDAHNVVGFINNKKKKTIIIGAHQDHLGYNEFGGSRSKEQGMIHNGADDNASGVAMMLQLMRTIKKSKKLRKNNYLFIAFSGEEQGLTGSKYFVNNPVIDIKTIKYMLNFDMVGRLDSIKKVLMIYGVGTSPEWKKCLDKVNADTNRIKIRTTESGTGSSDHTSFYYKDLPVLHYFTGQHKEYHTPADDEYLINYQGMYYCYDVVLQMIKAVNKTKEFPFTPTKQEESTRMSFKVTLGIMPDYVYDGTGVRVDGVNSGKPGDQAGLKQGDIILKMGNFTIVGMQDYMKALGSFNKGDKTTLTIKRGTEEMILNLAF